MSLIIVFAGFIIQALPQCKIICLRRNGLDTVVSNYRQLFSPHYRYCDYALDLASTAKFYREFERLAKFWQQRFPDNFLLVDYEQVVTEPSEQAKKIMAFCQLPWHDNLIAIENNSSAVATASSVQVRQPITANNIGNWQKYEAFLAPIKAILNSKDD